MAEFISAHHYKYDLNGNVILEQDTEIASDDSGITYTIQDLGNDTYVSDYGWGMETQEGAVIQTTSGFRRTYSWNERNLITTTSDNRYLVNYRYDHSGERVGKFAVQNNGGSASETLYFNKMWSWRYDGLQSERLGRNSKHIYLGATRILTKVARADGYETSEDSIKQYYYHNDHLGSAQLITNADGEEYERIEYTPYGELWVEKASAASNIDIPYRFTGKERDEETGLYYFGARYLDPKTSRWLSADPALGDYIPGAPVNDEAKKRNGNLPGMGGVFNLVNLHLYHYAGNNPVKYIDPTGLWTKKMGDAVQGAIDLEKEYKLGSWDCDIFVEHIVNTEGSGASLPDSWNAAASTNVAQHLKDMKDDLKDAPERGTNIVFHGGNHAMIMGVNDDGSVDVSHISSSSDVGGKKLANNLRWKSLADFEAHWKKQGNGDLKYVPLNDAEPLPVQPVAPPVVQNPDDPGAGK